MSRTSTRLEQPTEPHYSDARPYLQCEVCGDYIIAPPGADFCACSRSGRNGSAPVGRLLSEVEPEKVEWLWQGRVPKGKLTVIDGDPGTGKSAATTDLAARVSVGRPWPDGAPCEAAGVVICNAEDGAADTIRPRLDTAGGDASRVLELATVPDGDGERLISIPEDLAVIRRGIEQVEAGLVVVDPLMAFLSDKVNSHRDQDVRRALAPLSKLAEETGAAVVVVRHLNKTSGGNPLYRGGGSIGIVGAARSALLVAEHPEDEGRRILARIKGNLAKPVPSLAFALTEAPNGAVRVEWKGETAHTAAALLAAPTDPEEKSALAEASEFLRDVLRRGPVWSVQVKEQARDAGISEFTLKRAKSALGVISEKEGDGSWSWRLPDQASKGIADTPASGDDPLDPLDSLPIDKGDEPDHRGDQVSPLPRRGSGKRIRLIPLAQREKSRCLRGSPRAPTSKRIKGITVLRTNSPTKSGPGYGTPWVAYANHAGSTGDERMLEPGHGDRGGGARLGSGRDRQEMTGSESFPPRQQQALRALLENPTIAAAAENCGLSERTLYRYLEDADFLAQYQRLRARLVDQAVAELQKIGVEAVGVLRASFEDESVSVRLRAARTALDLMFKGTEFSDWEDRLRQLEGTTDETAHW
jgi:hypothetical protein